MEPFPLFQVPITNLERIVNKCEWVSYFRLQQTCRDLRDLVQNSRNIKNSRICPVAYMNYALFLEEDNNGSTQLRSRFQIRNKFYTVPTPYGIRFHNFSPESYNDFEEYCIALKKHRITCSHLIIRHFDLQSKQECTRLFKILKPTKIILYSSGSDRFEAIFDAKELNDVSVTVDLDSVLHNDLFWVKKVLASYEKVSLHVDSKEIYRQFSFFRKILQFLGSSPLPNLRCLLIHGTYARTVNPQPSLRKIAESLDRFDLALVRKVKLQPRIWEYHFKCPLGNSIPFCRLVISDNHAQIHFEPKLFEDLKYL